MEEIRKEALALKASKPVVSKPPPELLSEVPEERAPWRREVLERKRHANIIVVGVGGAGTNTVNTLMKLGIEGARCVAINTDARHLEGALADVKLLIGEELTNGLGTGGDPLIGRAAAERDRDKIFKVLGQRPDLVFITAGMGGGTGTGAAPVVARIAREKRAIVVAVVTLPFEVEGEDKKEIALDGIAELKKYANAVILISNEKLRELTGDLPLQDALAIADYTLAIMVKGITEIINKRTYMNIDFADVRTLFLSAGGVAAVGIGESDDPKRRIEEAVNMAIENKLLEYSLEGAKGALLVITGGPTLTMNEAMKAADIVKAKMGNPKANVKIGVDTDERFGDRVRVILFVAGISSPYFIPGTRVRPIDLEPVIWGDPAGRERILDSEDLQKILIKRIKSTIGRDNIMRF
ncbi:MAG TPA: cell division protein FtsZ [Candidatus Korarchaeota archaeon]|nr:MAG: cell division protein FtsZ [Candidatus Korarchaeota archaeon]HDD68968.1 cell division protein FtsZ [Candidatus Korarchaeota archaeon]